MFRAFPLPADFKTSFPILSWWVARPWAVLALAGMCGIFLGWIYGPIFGLAALCLSAPLMGMALERKVLGRILIPPFTAYCFWAGLGTGFGVPIVYFCDGERWLQPFVTVQAAFLFTLPLAAASYFLGGWRKVEEIKLIGEVSFCPGSAPGPCLWLAWGWFLYSAFIQLVQVGVGLEDRSLANPIWSPSWNPYGWTFFLRIFPQAEFLGYTFAPFLWRAGTWKSRICLGLLLGVVLAMNFSTGARGLVIYPLMFLFLGAYLFRASSSPAYEKFLLGLLALGVVGTWILYQSRVGGSSGKPLLVERVKNLTDIRPGSWKETRRVRAFGYSFLGVEDARVYARVPQEVPYVGWAGFRAILFTWVPSYFARHKPILLDGARAAGSVCDPPVRELRGHGLSLSADSFRRFGPVGWFVVIPLYFLAYGCLARFLLRARPGQPALSLGFLVFCMGFFHSHPFCTVLTTWHSFAYNLPKHIVVLAAVCWIFNRMDRRASPI